MAGGGTGGVYKYPGTLFLRLPTPRIQNRPQTRTIIILNYFLKPAQLK